MNNARFKRIFALVVVAFMMVFVVGCTAAPTEQRPGIGGGIESPGYGTGTDTGTDGAQQGQGAIGGNGGGNGQPQNPPGLFGAPMIILWVGMFAAMYFLLFRPQRKRAKQAEEMQRALRVGDRVLSSGGLYGTIMGVGEDAFLVEFGENRGVRIWIRKSDILGIKEPVTTPEVQKIEEKQ